MSKNIYEFLGKIVKLDYGEDSLPSTGGLERPYDHPMRNKGVFKFVAKVEPENSEEKDIMNNKKIDEKIDRLVEKLLLESKYSLFFKGMMKAHGIKNIADLSDAKKKKFFDAVKKAWAVQKKK